MTELATFTLTDDDIEKLLKDEKVNVAVPVDCDDNGNPISGQVGGMQLKSYITSALTKWGIKVRAACKRKKNRVMNSTTINPVQVFLPPVNTLTPATKKQNSRNTTLTNVVNNVISQEIAPLLDKKGFASLMLACKQMRNALRGTEEALSPIDQIKAIYGSYILKNTSNPTLMMALGDLNTPHRFFMIWLYNDHIRVSTPYKELITAKLSEKQPDHHVLKIYNHLMNTSTYTTYTEGNVVYYKSELDKNNYNTKLTDLFTLLINAFYMRMHHLVYYAPGVMIEGSNARIVNIHKSIREYYSKDISKQTNTAIDNSNSDDVNQKEGYEVVLEAIRQEATRNNEITPADAIALAVKFPNGRFEKYQKKGGSRLKTKKYEKTTQKHKGRDGVMRVVYERLGKSYVKKRDPKTGAFVYRVVILRP